MNKFKKVLALVCACTMLGTSLAGCTQTGTDEDAGNNQGAANSDTPLVVGYMEFSSKFSPFYAETSYDQDVASLVVPGIMTIDRSGAIVYNAIEGETRAYNGTDYTYTGPADIACTVNDDGTTVYNIKIRDDIYFSDGEKMTADDIIFSYYVLADNSYTGSSTIFSTPIVGMKNYRLNNSNAEKVTDEAIAEWLASDDGKAAVNEKVIAPVLTAELDWVKSIYGDENYAAYTEAYPVAKDLFAALYALDEEYDSAAVEDEAQVVADVIAQYNGDYAALGDGYAGDKTYFSSQVNDIAIEAVAATFGDSEEVTRIEGIKKLSDTEVEITCSYFDAAAIYQICGISVAPMHYYGDASLYDYDNDKFGFTRGDLSIVESKTTEPMGWGPYKFVKYENKVVYFEAYENYYGGTPVTKYVQFKETAASDMISGVVQGTIDISTPDGSLERMQEIAANNSNGEVTGDKLSTQTVDFLGYGYIGISAKNVAVGEDADSDASKNLRKGIATILAAYRQLTIDSYYGDAASVINYPISNTSWAAPQKTDEGYEVAFSMDVNGNDIYTSEMTAEEKYAAAAQAALGYFEAAGYTVEDGKITAAPEGAKLDYTIYIGGGGSGDHPTFALLTAAKEAFASIGFTLTINDPADSNEMWNAMNSGTAEMWCAAWGATPDPDMYQVYHGNNVIGKDGSSESNKYFIEDAELDSIIMEARTSADQAYRKGLYKDALDIVLDWAVEVPVYQRKDAVLTSVERVNMDTMTKDLTPYWTWLAEIDKIAMN